MLNSDFLKIRILEILNFHQCGHLLEAFVQLRSVPESPVLAHMF